MIIIWQLSAMFICALRSTLTTYSTGTDPETGSMSCRSWGLAQRDHDLDSNLLTQVPERISQELEAKRNQCGESINKHSLGPCLSRVSGSYVNK